MNPYVIQNINNDRIINEYNRLNEYQKKQF